MTSQAQLNLMMMLHLMGWLDLPSVEWDVGLTRTARRKRCCAIGRRPTNSDAAQSNARRDPGRALRWRPPAAHARSPPNDNETLDGSPLRRHPLAPRWSPNAWSRDLHRRRWLPRAAAAGDNCRCCYRTVAARGWVTTVLVDAAWEMVASVAAKLNCQIEFPACCHFKFGLVSCFSSYIKRHKTWTSLVKKKNA